MVSSATQVSLLSRHGSHSPGQLISLSLVEAVDRGSTLPLSTAGQLVQQWWPPCNFLMAQSNAACSIEITSRLELISSKGQRFSLNIYRVRLLEPFRRLRAFLFSPDRNTAELRGQIEKCLSIIPERPSLVSSGLGCQPPAKDLWQEEEEYKYHSERNTITM